MDKSIKKAFIHHRNLFLKGQFEISAIYSAVTLIIVFINWLSKYISMYDWMAIPFATILFILFQYKYGHWFDKEDLFDEDYLWHSKRNPILMAILSRKRLSL